MKKMLLAIRVSVLFQYYRQVIVVVSVAQGLNTALIAVLCVGDMFDLNITQCYVGV